MNKGTIKPLNVHDRLDDLEVMLVDMNGGINSILGRLIKPTLAEAVVQVAREEIGNGEVGKNNHGPALKRYREAVDGKHRDGYQWCAAFVSYCLDTAAAQLQVDLPFKLSLGARRLRKNVGKAGSFVKTPQPGDLFCWKYAGWRGHIGIVSKVQGMDFWAIEGNRGKFPSKVGEYKHAVGEPRLMTFARLPRL